jgi:adhesin/invasin
MTLLILNKDPSNTMQAQFTMNGFTPQQVTSYTLASTNPTQIVKSKTTTWSPTVTVAPYTATLLVITGSAQLPGAEWDLNPDTTMVPAGGNVVLQPKITSGTATVTLGTPQADSGITVTVPQPTLSKGNSGKITVTAGTTPGFYHYSVPSTDTAGVAQQQGGYILVGNPPATFTKTGDKQKGAAGSQLTLSVTLIPGQSGGSAGGGTVLFTTNAGLLSGRTATTDSTGKASVVLTLPSTAGSVRITAEGQYALGHPMATFTETAQ